MGSGNDSLWPLVELPSLDPVRDGATQQLGEAKALRDLGQFLVAQMRVQKPLGVSRVDDPRPVKGLGRLLTRRQHKPAGVLVRENDVPRRLGVRSRVFI